jgi:hypothetical protein
VVGNENQKGFNDKSMKFQYGDKFAKGGKRPGAGRPTKEQQEIKKQAAEVAREFIETHVQKFLDSYLDLAAGKVIERLDKDGKVVKLVMIDPATVRHAIDKILPDEQMQHAQPLKIIFQEFARAAPSQLPPKDIPITVSRNASGDQKSLAPHRANDLLPAPEAEEKRNSRTRKSSSMSSQVETESGGSERSHFQGLSKAHG